MNSSGTQMRQGNSPNHEGDGQNILYGDGHVTFEITPFGGINKDNLYARRAGPSGTSSSGVVNSSYDKDDNVLLPTND